MSETIQIDLITEDPIHGEWVLYLVEDAPWPTDEPGWKMRLKAIQDHVLSAVDVAIYGHFAQRYPESSGSRVRVQIDSPSGCPPRVEELVSAIRQFLNEDEGYRAGVEQAEHVAGVRVVTGKEIGRFGEDK
jgi:hypothetical protein